MEGAVVVCMLVNSGATFEVEPIEVVDRDEDLFHARVHVPGIALDEQGGLRLLGAFQGLVDGEPREHVVDEHQVYDHVAVDIDALLGLEAQIGRGDQERALGVYTVRQDGVRIDVTHPHDLVVGNGVDTDGRPGVVGQRDDCAVHHDTTGPTHVHVHIEPHNGGALGDHLEVGCVHRTHVATVEVEG